MADPPAPPASAAVGGSQRLLFTHDLVSGRYRGSVRFGLVRVMHGEDSDSEEDEAGRGPGGGSGGNAGGVPGGVPGGGAGSSGGSESGAPCGGEESRGSPLRRGYVRVQWYPEGIKQHVKETKLKLEDRSVVPRDVVRHMGSRDSQCGTVVDVNIECAVKLVGTNCILYPVNSKDLQNIWPFMYGDCIAYDWWLGKVYDLKNQIILKLSNGARCSMSTEDAAKLYDVCPHVSDSGLFFDDSYGFYPGQVLIGPSKVFSNVQWLSGVKPVLSTKSKFRVVVEEVQVVELKVTWITKSFCPGGTDSISPPPSLITQENLSRVKRLGCFDHAERQLGERCLYVFPEKVEPAKITCECPERNCVLGEGAVAKKMACLCIVSNVKPEKVRRLLKKQIVKIMSCSPDSQGTTHLPEGESAATGDQQSEDLKPISQCELEESANGAVRLQEIKEEHLGEIGKGITCEAAGLQLQPPFVLKRDDISSDYKLQSIEQDADDEAADDTDDTSSVTSSASSTASSQSGSGTGRKKSIPLSIKNLKRKHKKKKTKVSREFKPGDRVAVEVVTTMTSADVMWQDGTVEKNIRSNELFPVHHLDNNEFCPGDFVVDKRAQSSLDPGMYGVVQSGDHVGRTCMVKWFKLKPSGDDVELIGEEEDVSVYDIADHPDFRFRTTDFVIRIGNAEDGASISENEASHPSVGQVARVDFSSKVEVVWADNSRTIVLPQHLYNIESEMDEETDLDSIDGSTSGASSDEWEDESDSWETDNGLMEDDHSKTEEAEPEEPPPVEEVKKVEEQVQGAVAMAVADLAADKSGKEGTPKSFRELKEAIKILESLKNMTVEQLLTGYPTSPTVEPEKPTREKKFLDDIKKLQENLKKTLDNVAIVEEEKMEPTVEAEKKEDREAQTPVASEWPSETPVLCQQSGGKPGVTFTSAKGEVFSVLEFAPDSHAFKKMEFQPPEAKKFFSTVRKEMALLATSLPDGIMVKTFEDRMDLFSALVKGPTRTPYEDGLFLFDIQLPNIYPAVPPLFRYLSQCSGRLNPNLYDNGKVCVSLLGTWIGKGTERWTSKSSLLQVLISIQGLILVNEPYYNEAGFDSDRGLQEGYENSRCYNEMALIRVVQSMMQLLRKPVEVFEQEIYEHFCCNGWRLIHRIESWVETNELVERSHDQASLGDSCFVHSACGILAESPVDSMGPLGEQELGAAAAASLLPDGREELEDSGCGISTLTSSDTHQYSDSESMGQARAAHFARDLTDESKATQDSASQQPSVKPKKRRKSYRSFLPERSGYPDIGFPLFPLSKGFIKSIRGVLQQYRAALVEANIPEWTEDK
ncbi:(E3-independent) E2 ubiquitin-conjugating enzyme isoform X1 [Eublepharis macularius]|uniref:(E3-independent) E2 ubiquitin-conjugating enzyme n=1 Tax=Eublepharis macularius TaxID=481883 RepID=A0AA97KVQ8_EUBMA|nr:(E3-independent) E2 ubiquitin-conjugating enzyme isoform X1 [Eublepharis macularius]